MISEYVVWYLLLATAPGAIISYPKPIGPFTEDQCQRVKTIHLTSKLAPVITSSECKKAIGFKTCVDVDDHTRTCPIF